MTLLYQKGEKPNVLTHKVGEECYNIADKKTYVLDKFGEAHGFSGIAQGLEVSPYSSKNWFINGAPNIWQMGTSFNSNSGRYTADEWWVGNCAVSKSTIVSGNRITFSGTNTDQSFFRRRIENGYLLNGKKVTLSFDWVSSAASPSSAIYVKFKSGTSIELTWDAGVTQKVVISFTMPSDAATGDYFQVYAVLSNTGDTGGEGTLSNLQLELGNIATEFERTEEAIELVKCQRHYEEGQIYHSGVNRNNTGGNATSSFLVQKSTIPTIAGVVDLTINWTGINVSAIIEHGFHFNPTGGSDSAQGRIRYTWWANSPIE